MIDLTNNPSPIPEFISSMEMRITNNLSRIRTQCNQAKEVVRELTQTTRYASMSVSTALAMAHRIIEMRSEQSQGDDLESFFQECSMAYTLRVEKIIEALNQTLVSISTKNNLDHFTDFCVSWVQNVVESLTDIKSASLGSIFPTLSLIRLTGKNARRSIRKCTHQYLDQMMYPTTH